MSLLKNINIRHALKKQQSNTLSPLEQVGASIQEDVKKGFAIYNQLNTTRWEKQQQINQENAAAKKKKVAEDTLVKKDWRFANAARKLHGKEAAPWEVEAKNHEMAHLKHAESASKQADGSQQQQLHKDAAAAHKTAQKHAEGILDGTHKTNEYLKVNQAANEASGKARPIPMAAARKPNPFKGMVGGLKLASEEGVVECAEVYSEILKGGAGSGRHKGGIPKSTFYKLVHRASGNILAEGNAKNMHKQNRALNKQHGVESHFVGITSKPVGSNWNG